MRSRELLELRAIFKGRVQGVGFRATVKMFADQLKLVGFARNLADGNVEVCAQGEKPALEKLIAQVKAEFGGHIQNVDFSFGKVSQTFSDFSIKR